MYRSGSRSQRSDEANQPLGPAKCGSLSDPFSGTRVLDTNAPCARTSRYHRQLSDGRKVMPETEVEKLGVVPAGKAVDSKIVTSRAQDCAESEDLLRKSAPGRLPARAF